MDGTVSLAASTFSSTGKAGFLLVPSWRRQFCDEVDGMTGAVELWMLVMSPGRVVWDNILDGTQAMVSSGSRTGHFRLSYVLSSEYCVLFFSQKE